MNPHFKTSYVAEDFPMQILQQVQAGYMGSFHWPTESFLVWKGRLCELRQQNVAPL